MERKNKMIKWRELRDRKGTERKGKIKAKEKQNRRSKGKETQERNWNRSKQNINDRKGKRKGDVKRRGGLEKDRAVKCATPMCWWAFLPTGMKDGSFLRRWNFSGRHCWQETDESQQPSAEKTAGGANLNNNADTKPQGYRLRAGRTPNKWC